MGPAFANPLEIDGKGTHKKRSDIESKTVSLIQ